MTASPAITVRDRALYGQAAEVIVAARQGLAWEEDAEFSDYGRSPRFPSGSWLVWAIPAGLAGWAVLLTLGKAIALAAWAAVNGGGL